jgi:hypothetical protein
MKFLLFVVGIASVFVITNSLENGGGNLMETMAQILNVQIESQETPKDQIPIPIPKATTLAVTPEMLEIVQKLRDHFGSAWNRKED